MTTAIDEIYRRLNDDTEAPEIDWSDSKIRKFFAGKSILLSGATGFMGKVFVEKILRDCPDIKSLYVLVRHENSVTSKDKMKKYFENVIFKRLRSINPNFEDKVFTVSGDLEKERLGLSDDDRQTISETVDIIVHNGASTRFDNKISESLRNIVLGTKYMLDLAMECKHIKVFVHVSTAYSHCYRKDIEETFYDPPIDLKTVYDIIAFDEETKEGLNEDALNTILGKYPNTYCFSKATAEGLVKQYGDKANFAMGLYRPTIVGAAVKEPSPGWVGNNNGPTLIFLGGALGLMHTGYHSGYPIDLIPVDYSINSLIGIIHDVSLQWQVEKQPIVYNYGSSTLNPISLPKLFDFFVNEMPNIGSKRILWHAFFIFCKSKWKFWFFHIFFHFIPAVFADVALLCMDKKTRALKLFFFGTKHLDKIDYFGNGNWQIHASRAMETYDRMTRTDQEIFNYDIRKLDWEDTAVIWTRGGRIHLVKEPFDNVEETKMNYHRMKRLHYATATTFALLITYWAIKLLLYLFNSFF